MSSSIIWGWKKWNENQGASYSWFPTSFGTKKFSITVGIWLAGNPSPWTVNLILKIHKLKHTSKWFYKFVCKLFQISTELSTKDKTSETTFLHSWFMQFSKYNQTIISLYFKRFWSSLKYDILIGKISIILYTPCTRQPNLSTHTNNYR